MNINNKNNNDKKNGSMYLRRAEAFFFSPSISVCVSMYYMRFNLISFTYEQEQWNTSIEKTKQPTEKKIEIVWALKL